LSRTSFRVFGHFQAFGTAQLLEGAPGHGNFQIGLPGRQGGFCKHGARREKTRPRAARLWLQHHVTANELRAQEFSERIYQ
jgi:hypothetical protein